MNIHNFSKKCCFKGYQRNRAVARGGGEGESRESRVFVVFKVGEIMACLCANGNDPGKREN